MSIAVAHDRRKNEILEKALDVFVNEGYEDTTFQKIAERCGITRTILYLYFKNKKEIFAFSIKLFTQKLESEIMTIGADPGMTQSEKLVAIATMAVEVCSRESKLLGVVTDYLRHIRASGGDAEERVRRRTIRMRHILSGLIIEGQNSGEFDRFPVKPAAEMLYALIEAAIFRIAVLGKGDAKSLQTVATFIVSRCANVAGTSAPAGTAGSAKVSVPALKAAKTDGDLQ